MTDTICSRCEKPVDPADANCNVSDGCPFPAEAQHDYTDTDVRILHGDAIERMADLEAGSAHTCVTSPPYYGLRDYGTGDAQIGLEQTPDEYIARLVEVFRAVRHVLRDDGTLWLNLGDSYAATQSNNGGYSAKSTLSGFTSADTKGRRSNDDGERVRLSHGAKPKDLLGMPWRVALALQADGWYLRSDIIWHKPNPMPESVTDRPTKAHEYVFLLAKSQRYYYDADAIKEKALKARAAGKYQLDPASGRNEAGTATNLGAAVEFRNKRTVWTVGSQAYPGAHFAVYPPALIEPCILAGSPEGGVVLDPFMGSGTTAHTARRLQRRSVGTELNADYIRLAAARLQQGSLLA